MRLVRLDPVGGQPPGVHVEGAVQLLGPVVVVLEGKLVAPVQVDVGLGQKGLGIIGAGDGSEFVVEETRPLRVEEIVEPGQIRRVVDQPVRLFRFAGDLLVVRHEKECPVAHDGAADSEAELTAEEVRLACLHRHRVGGGHAIPLPEIVGRTLQFVGTRLCDHIHKAPGGPPELGRRTLVHHHHLFDRVLAEGERRPLPAPLLAEEGIVEVGPVHDEVVEDAPLSADVQLVPVGPLGNRDAGSQQREVQVVAPVVGEPVDHILREAGGAGDVFGMHEVFALRLDCDPLERDRLEAQRQGQLLTDAQDQAGRRGLHKLAVGPRHDIVGAEREERAHEGTGRRGPHGGDQAGLAVRHLDDCARDGGAGRVQDHTPDDAGGCL